MNRVIVRCKMYIYIYTKYEYIYGNYMVERKRKKRFYVFLFY